MNKILPSIFLLLITLSGYSQSIEEWNAKASEHVHSANYQEAIRIYTEITKLNPFDSAVYFDRAFAKHLAKDYNGAIEDFTKAAAIDSSNPDNYYLRGLSKMCMNNFADAKNDFTHALLIESENADVYYNRALAENELYEFTNAIQDFTKAIELNSDHRKEAYGNSAWAYAKLHRYKSAKQNCKKAKSMKTGVENGTITKVSRFCWCYFHKKSKQL